MKQFPSGWYSNCAQHGEEVGINSMGRYFGARKKARHLVDDVSLVGEVRRSVHRFSCGRRHRAGERSPLTTEGNSAAESQSVARRAFAINLFIVSLCV